MSAPAHVVSLIAPAGRFVSAWDAFQFACVHLERARKLYALAEIAGDAGLVTRYAGEVRDAETFAAAAEREWRDAPKA